ncbi:MAG: hypothetical protein VYC34_07390 [Planctomycetota bacterium]|nr:hypothetical protein [Planctomycetota bacterium]
MPALSETHDAGPARRLLARLGIAGFAFFFVKGLVWLAVAGAAAWGVF